MPDPVQGSASWAHPLSARPPRTRRPPATKSTRRPPKPERLFSNAFSSVLALPVASLLPPCLVKNVSSPAGKSYARKIYHARLVTHDDLDVTKVAAHPDPLIQVHERHPHRFSSPIFMIHSGSMSSAPSPRNPQRLTGLGRFGSSASRQVFGHVEKRASCPSLHSLRLAVIQPKARASD